MRRPALKFCPPSKCLPSDCCGKLRQPSFNTQGWGMPGERQSSGEGMRVTRASQGVMHGRLWRGLEKMAAFMKQNGGQGWVSLQVSPLPARHKSGAGRSFALGGSRGPGNGGRHKPWHGARRRRDNSLGALSLGREAGRGCGGPGYTRRVCGGANQARACMQGNSKHGGAEAGRWQLRRKPRRRSQRPAQPGAQLVPQAAALSGTSLLLLLRLLRLLNVLRKLRST